MKKLGSLLLLFVYLISLPEISQLVKLPNLVLNFNEHKQNNHQLTFIDFLSMHYNQTDDRDGDNEKDEQLPFKSFGNCAGTAFVAFFSNVCDYGMLRLVFDAKNTHTVYKENFIQQPHLSCIWQPPKFS